MLTLDGLWECFQQRTADLSNRSYVLSVYLLFEEIGNGLTSEKDKKKFVAFVFALWRRLRQEVSAGIAHVPAPVRNRDRRGARYHPTARWLQAENGQTVAIGTAVLFYRAVLDSSVELSTALPLYLVQPMGPTPRLVNARCDTLAPQPHTRETSRIALPRVGRRCMPAIRIDHSERSVGAAAKRAEMQMRSPAATGVA